MTNYRQVGGRLGAYIRTKNPTTQQIQGLLADLLAGDALLPTMRELATSPAFVALLELAGSGGGAIQRDALVQEIAARYLPAVVDEVRQLVNGMLDQPAGQTIYGSTPTLRPENSVSTPHQGEEHFSVETGDPGVSRSDAAAYQYINHQKPSNPRSPLNPAYGYIPDSRSQSVDQKGKNLGRALFLASIPVVLLAGLSFLTSIDTSTSTSTGQVSVNGSHSRTEGTSKQPASTTLANNEGPRYGHPVYDPSDGYTWTFYRHLNGVDWYLDPKSKKYDVPGGFQIMMRSVEPDNINFGPLYINASQSVILLITRIGKIYFPRKRKIL